MPTITPSSFREFLLEKRKHARQYCSTETITNSTTLQDATSTQVNTENGDTFIESCTTENNARNKSSIAMDQESSQHLHSNSNTLRGTELSKIETEWAEKVCNIRRFNDDVIFRPQDMPVKMPITLDTGEKIQECKDNHTRQYEIESSNVNCSMTKTDSNPSIPLDAHRSKKKFEPSNNHALASNVKFDGMGVNSSSVHTSSKSLGSLDQSSSGKPILSITPKRPVQPLVDTNFLQNSKTIFQDTVTNDALIPSARRIKKDIFNSLERPLESNIVMERVHGITSDLCMDETSYTDRHRIMSSEIELTAKVFSEVESSTSTRHRIHDDLNENYRKKIRLHNPTSNRCVENSNIEDSENGKTFLKSIGADRYNEDSQLEIKNIASPENSDRSNQACQSAHDNGKIKELENSKLHVVNSEQGNGQITKYSDTVTMSSHKYIDDLARNTEKKFSFDARNPDAASSLNSSDTSFRVKLEENSISQKVATLEVFNGPASKMSNEEEKKKTHIPDPTPTKHERSSIINKSNKKGEMKDASKQMKTPNVIARFPRPSEQLAIKHLISDFGLEVEESMNDSTNYKFEGKGFKSIGHLRDYLCRVGLVATPEWIDENMKYERFYCSSFGKQDLYIPKTAKAKCLTNWIRLAIVPEEYLQHPIEELSKSDVQEILAKFNVKLQLGYYTFNGDLVQWKDLERKFATSGLSEELWEHPGATLSEKLSLLNFFMDYSTIVLQHLKSEGGTRRRPKRRSTLQSEKVDDRNSSPVNNHPQKAEPKQKKVKSKKSSEIDDSLNQMKKESKIDLSDFPFFSDDEVKHKKRRDLDPLPPKRKRQRRKSLFCGPRRLQTEEFEGSNKFSLSSLYFWDTLGETRPKSDDFSWGRPIGYRRHMGRVYYDSFELSGELFNVGNFVMIDNSSLYKLISAFQATKSFVGRWNSPKDEIQTRGHIYVELAPMQQDVENAHICFLEAVTEWNPDHVEGAPIQVLSNSGKSCDIKNVVVECTAVCESTLKSSRKGNIKTIPFDPKQRELVTESDPFILVSQYALDSWPEIINAKFVVLYGNEREFKLGENEGYTAFESDDSDGFDETSCKHFMKGKINWNNELECDTITKRKEAMVMYTGSIKVEKEVNAKSLHGIFKELNPLLDKSIQFDESLENTVESLRKELLFRTATARLSDYFVLKQVPRVDKGGIIKEFAVEIGFNRYKSKIQQLACEHSIKCQDTVMIAPCGSGKSMVFVQAALRSGGVSIVIEPLNAIIKSQLRELKYLSPYISMEQLLSEEEAKHQRSPSSINRLQIIINEVKASTWISKPLILFATPELIEPRLSQLGDLADEGCLKAITIDEMDMIEQSHGSYRGVYAHLLEKLRNYCSGVKFMFLSGTITTRGLVSLLPPGSLTKTYSNDEKPVLFLSQRALADSLSFRVERKTNDEQVADRIVFWLKGSENGVKCLCYCLTKSRCHTISKYLNLRGITADTITGDDNLQRKECVLHAFSNGKIQVLCCTSVLGRGFHLDDIRFVFHAAVPVDLTEYIQQAGRAGRDGKQARCILFFRAQDFAVVRRIKLQSNECEKLKASVESEITKVHAYAMSSECRYSHLAATATIDQCKPAEQKCTKEAPCDNCEMESTDKRFFEVNHIFNSMIGHSHCDFDNKKNALSDDLLQLFINTQVLKTNGRQLFPASCFDIVHESLRSNALRFFVRVEKRGLPPKSSLVGPLQDKKVLDVDSFQSEYLQNTFKAESSDPLDFLNISFVVRFEAERVKQKVHDCESEIVDWIHRNNEDVNNHRSVFKFLNSFLPQHQKWHFDSVLRASDQPNESNNFEKRKDGLVGLYYYAELDENNVICLQHPQPAVSRRIFRKFGSHRFLHVMVSSKLLDQNVVNKFSEKVMLCGRKYAYLWCKAQKTPQCFVLFAESGYGIEDEISVDYVRDWCIPKKLNPELTIAKELKRMKISFSKTRPSAVLPENTIEIIPDILGNLGKPMTDGAGLISRCAINEVWKAYSGKDEWCPFSSFQGRIGGFKGMWILDELLSGFSLKCRDSQLKFMVPMRSLVKAPHLDLSGFDPNYDTVEISSWDEIPEKGHLSVRLVQILERRGVSIDFFLRCVDSGLDWLDELSGEKESSKDKFFQEIRNRHCSILETNLNEEMKDDDMLFYMAAAKLDPSEPFYAEQRRKFVKKTADKIRKKARYPLKDSWYVRMLPDHTQLLLENEAFLALPNEYRGSLDSATELLAFRNPSYFDGDLRKLKLVNYDDLLLRAYDKGNHLVAQVQGFFKSLTVGIILSTIGDESVADMMSGGDFDGDKAWVCFDPELVNQVSGSPPPMRPAMPEAHAKERILATASTLRERIKFARHFKFHQQQLGCLANTLDSAIDTVDDFTMCPAIVDIASQAFLQVDHPYQLCMPKAEAADFLRSQKQPHWSLDQALVEGEEHERAYKSGRALGRLWDYVQEKIEKAVSLGVETPNVHIMQIAETAQSKLDPNLYRSMKASMRSAAVRYKLEMKAMIEARASLDMIAARSREIAEIERERLLIEPFPEEERALAAAILYEVCGESKSFAWKLARDYLCIIVVRAQNVGNKSLPYMMDPEIDKLAFQKKRK